MGVFTAPVRVRHHECDSYGHVNNAVYTQYLAQLTLDAHGIAPQDAPLWSMRRLAVEFHTPAVYGDALLGDTWVAEAEDGSLTHDYRLTRPSDERLVVAARAVWSTSLRPSLAPLAETLTPSPLKPFSAPTDNGSLPFLWRHQVARYEVGASGCVPPWVYLNWLEEATFSASTRAGWSIERMLEHNLVILQFRHDAEFLADARLGQAVEIVSRLIEVKRVRGMWLHEVFSVTPRVLLMRDYSTGVFLDRSGRMRASLAPMMADLVRGEPR